MTEADATLGAGAVTGTVAAAEAGATAATTGTGEQPQCHQIEQQKCKFCLPPGNAA